MKQLSLRWRLTLVTVAVLAAICAVTSFHSIFNAKQMMTPVTTDIATIGLAAQDMSDTVAIFAGDALFEEVDLARPSDDGTFQYAQSALGDVWIRGTPAQTTAPSEVSGVESMDVLYVATQSAALVNQVETISFAITAAQESFNYSSLVFMVAMILLGGVLVYFVSGYALKPVRNLSHDIKAIGGDQLSQRVTPTAGSEEINDLADSFNAMLARLELAFSAQKRFSTAAAHELKTPLATIRTNVDVLKLSDAPTEEDYRELMDVLTRQTTRMSQLVDDLFTMSSLQECDLKDDVPLDALLDSVADELLHTAEEKDIALSVDAVPCGLKGNQLMLSRAISNIVENAIRYTPTGGSVHLHCSRDGDDVCVTVSDSGPGIAEEHLPLIFDPFYRVDPSRSRSLGGAGIGLAIAEQIVAQHGGRITAENREEGGCRFTLIIPRA